ncbi:5-formyltetrahydrofolate cyclo-ligase [Metarhizium album ARSEF 1941]|uniref:5-formyltetrahydrofolate cyclo-ligase n=1 Tax=Metarhizium album (strain ARSEF 1941) TaxID=1081103 RepID=A0A0B2WL47_METAS|nr:5-formyltetrahydrofolate cyclo-ligase [Metarhizium album ARSEF 1941]KHN94207.1 5-formyltetrahydrofolate cyclo-ligase [Metarhizium album ARSEF 1941]
MTLPLSAAKQQLRSLMKQRLAAVPADSITAQSRRIFESLKDFRPYLEAKRISIYLSMPSGEVQTDAIVRHALEAGKQVFVPYLPRSSLDTPGTPARVMDMVHLRDIQDYEGLHRDHWGIPSIDPATVHERQRILGGPDAQRSDQAGLDLMLLPGVAFDFDESGAVRRLGHGKGFYDFFMNRYLAKTASPANEAKVVLFYGLALTEQLLSDSSGEHIPMGPYDRRLHGLVLGSGQIQETSGSMTPY